QQGGSSRCAVPSPEWVQILTYLGCLALQARAVRKQIELTPERLRFHGQSIPLFPGVETWFDRINQHACEQGIELEHYIVSSGIEEMILGTSISRHFKRIFGCRYHYDKKSGNAKWPAVAINYTTKTQYIFRINKGVLNSYDNSRVNEYVEPTQREVPFQRMIYLGDGDTDIPCMRLVKDQGGCSVAVFDEEKWGQPGTLDKIGKLIAEDRVNFVVPGNYDDKSQLDVTVKGVLRRFARQDAHNVKAV
ncbi:haloacid dehalogenase-like hydrolase, partial [Cyanobium sp. FGCU-52]|nr:haloacid dehalogenase-like hydrolase [Cyanobium sp. FGCU52]